MPARRTNPNRVKLHRSYSVDELARCFNVHKNTVRHWQAKGMEPIDENRPILFQGRTVRTFLANRNANRKRPCPPGTIYCFRCRSPRTPARNIVYFVPMRLGSGNLRALCQSCDAVMHRRVREENIGDVMPNCTVQLAQGQASLNERGAPSLNSDFKKQG